MGEGRFLPENKKQGFPVPLNSVVYGTLQNSLFFVVFSATAQGVCPAARKTKT